MTDTKNCNDCNIILTEDNKVKEKNQCKSCRSIKYKEYVKTKLTNNYNETIERKCTYCSIVLNQDNQVKNRPNCKSCYNANCKKYKQANKDKVTENNKLYYEANKEKIADYYKDHYIKNKDTYMENNRKWRKENRAIINDKANERFRTNPTARLVKNTRTRISKCLKGHSLQSIDLVDCDISFLKKWLKSQFDKNMTFENYGTYWHVDHVIPCSLFNLTNDDEIKYCFRWTNLQPLEGKENMSKQNNIDKDEVIQHYKKVKNYATKHNITIPDFDYTKYF